MEESRVMEDIFFIDHNIWLDHFNDLDQNGRYLAEYIWIGGSGQDLRSKTKSLLSKPNDIEDLPIWNFDGSSTGQAPGNDSEVLLKPVAIFKDPFRRGENILVLCECLKPDGTPVESNTRAACKEVMDKVKDQEPWFGMEQEYSLMAKNGRPLGWPSLGGFPSAQGPYYCGNGANKAFGRAFVEAHYKACLYAGIQVSGINAEVMPSQWEFQVGPCEGINMGDQLWIARYIMHRLGELFHVTITFDPKVISGDWNGAGCHTNFSTKAMREKGGFKEIMIATEKLRKNHKLHVKHYGEGNERRLTGKHETASIDVFSVGVADRGASIRIPRDTERDGCGYMEDRRPASNCDPYVVNRLMIETICLDL